MREQQQPRQAVKTPEAYEKAEIDKYLKSIGAYNAKPATYGYGVSGECDRLVCIAGWFVGIEVKREGKEPTPLQQRRIANIRLASGEAFWGTAAKVIPEIEEFRRRKGLR